MTEAMTDKPDGRRSRWWHATWSAPLLILVYALSCGPAMDAASETGVDSIARRIFAVIYWPIFQIVAYAPSWISDPLWWLASLLSLP